MRYWNYTIKPRDLVFAFLLSAVGVSYAIATHEDPLTPGEARELRKLAALLSEPLVGIEIHPAQFSRKSYLHRITDPEELGAFVRAAEVVNHEPVSGGSGSIHECILVIRTAEAFERYRASVHRYDPEDLFLTSQFPVRRPDGSFHSGPLPRIRLPGLGDWIRRVAPEGERYQDH